MPEPLETVSNALGFIGERSNLRPVAGLVLGSGWGGLANMAEVEAEFPYSSLPGLRQPTVAGHRGRLALGTLAGTPVAVFDGRSHFYEHGDMQTVAMPIRLLHALGCRYLVTTCAAGGLNPEMVPGDLMLVTDHICLPALFGVGPLVGDHGDERFVDMGATYDSELREIALSAANRLSIPIRQGVYAQTSGPQYETPAEQRLLRGLGADAVGMSVATEAIVARRLGLRVLAMACITNVADGAVSHAGVLAVGRRASDTTGELIRNIAPELK
jgi:purine-nucleoside phosphorylase